MRHRPFVTRASASCLFFAVRQDTNWNKQETKSSRFINGLHNSTLGKPKRGGNGQMGAFRLNKKINSKKVKTNQFVGRKRTALSKGKQSSGKDDQQLQSKTCRGWSAALLRFISVVHFQTRLSILTSILILETKFSSQSQLKRFEQHTSTHHITALNSI